MIKYKRSPIFYMGNKYKLLKDLIPLFPDSCDLFIDLFGGSGCVSMNYKGTEKTIYNEINTNIVELIKMIVTNEPKDLDKYWKNKINKYGLRQKSDKVNKGNGIASYTKLRNDYNQTPKRDYRDLFLLSCYSINHLIRFNKNNEFNASNGNDSYNDKNYKQICDMHEEFKNIEIVNGDAFDFDFSILTKDSFVYIDCPYSGTEAVYNEKRAFGGWTIESDLKLFSLLEKLSRGGDKVGFIKCFC